MTSESGPKTRTSPWELAVAPPPEKWEDWTEFDPAAWPILAKRPDEVMYHIGRSEVAPSP